MKKIALAAVCLIVLASIGAHVKLAQEAAKSVKRQAYVSGCTMAAKSILSMLGIDASDADLAKDCSTIAMKEGY